MRAQAGDGRYAARELDLLAGSAELLAQSGEKEHLHFHR
jgi:hypothetical protein